MSRYAKIAVVSLSILIFSYIGLGYLLAKTDDDKAYRSLNVYGEVLQRVQEDYVDEPNLSNVTAGALHGLLESLDPFSGYLSPREYADFKEKQKSTVHAEIGATLAKRFGYVVVVSVLPDSPAEKAGLRSGDIVEEIADFTTREMSVGQANSLLAGAPGSMIKVGLVRRGKTEPQAVTITRAVIPALHLTADKIDDGVGYVRIDALQMGAAAELRDKLQQFDKARPAQAGARFARLCPGPGLGRNCRRPAPDSLRHHRHSQGSDRFAPGVRRRSRQGGLAWTHRSLDFAQHFRRCGNSCRGHRR